jgi:hypothetical protein
MAEIRMLDAHDAVPDGRGRHVVVIKQFHEDSPRETVIQMILSRGEGPEELTEPVHADGRKMSFDEALRAARAVADSENIHFVYGIDRTRGPREREVLAARGDHTVNMDRLDDFDVEEGERGPDMEDRRSAAPEDYRADHEV